MKVSIISPFSFGYIDSLVEKVSDKSDLEVQYINTAQISFKYSNITQRSKNIFLKMFSGRNIKKEFIEKEIISRFEGESIQDTILIIRPDKLSRQLLLYLKSKTDKLITYFFDSLSSFPNQKENIDLFDKVYSYELDDVKKYNFHFITNFIPFDNFENIRGYGLFNISSYDKRFLIFSKIAMQLNDFNYPYKIVIRKEKPISTKLIEIVKDYWSLEKVHTYILEAEVLLDIQKEDQHGLSFRVFEALGYGKKLITSNQSIVNYDFYKPENILVINPLKPIIPIRFLEQRTLDVPESIKSKYRREAWIKEVFL